MPNFLIGREKKLLFINENLKTRYWIQPRLPIRVSLKQEVELSLLIKLSYWRLFSFLFRKADCFFWTYLSAHSTAKTIWNDSILSQDGTHDVTRTSLFTCKTSYAFLIIYFNFIAAHFFNNPSNQTKRTEEITPRSIDDNWCQKKQNKKYNACCSQKLGPENFKRIYLGNDVNWPNKWAYSKKVSLPRRGEGHEEKSIGVTALKRGWFFIR